jgi:thioredoxin-like negative regulator of GroEL
MIIANAFCRQTTRQIGLPSEPTMTKESARAYIALAIEVEEVRQEVDRAQQRLALDPRDRDAAEEVAAGRELLERLNGATSIFMKLLKEKPRGSRSLYDSADLV